MPAIFFQLIKKEFTRLPFGRGMPATCAIPLLLICFAGCGSKGPAALPTKLPEVIVDKPIVKEVTDFEDFTGRMESVKTVILRARVTGYLEKAYFQEGADVHEGDLLFEIDRRPYEAELDRATATVAQMKAKLDRLRAEYDRAQKLFKQRAMSKEEADRFEFDRLEAEAELAGATASQEIAALNLEFTHITAPFSGRISRRFVDPGNLVQADVTPLSNIVVLDPLHAHFDVDERTLLRVRRLISEGKIKSARDSEVNVQIGLADEEGFSLNGIINFVDNQVDPNTGTLRIRAAIPNPKLVLLPGLFVRIRVPIGTARSATLVPEEAVGSDQGQKYLYVLNGEDEVVYRRVQTGLLENGMRVIESGIGANDRVVVSGLQRIRPGVKVKPSIPANAIDTASKQESAATGTAVAEPATLPPPAVKPVSAAANISVKPAGAAASPR